MATDTSLMLTPKGPNAELERSIELASKALLDCQQPDGHWVFELEVDATIPAEYILLKHYLGERDELGIESKFTPDSARRGRMAAGLQRCFRFKRQRQGVFRAEDDWRPPGCRTHETRLSGDPRPRWRREDQCVHAG